MSNSARTERDRLRRIIPKLKRFRPKLSGVTKRKLNEAVDAAEDRRRVLNRKLDRPAPAPSRVVSRAEWGAAPPNGGYTLNRTVTSQVLHHTAGVQLPAKATREQEAQEMRNIQRFHQSKGWTDIGYHFVIFPSGRVYEGRPSNAVGAHTLGHNTGTIGICIAGDYEKHQPTKAAVSAAHDLRRKAPGSAGPIRGHRDLNATSCPGKNLYSRMKEIR